MAESGRPTKYNPDFDRQAEKLCELGATKPDLARFFDVAESTIARWMVENQGFSDALKVGKAAADDKVEMSLYHRALGYSHPEVDIRVIDHEIVKTKYKKVYPPDTTACIFWLKNRRPEKYRQNPEGSSQDALMELLSKLIDLKPN